MCDYDGLFSSAHARHTDGRASAAEKVKTPTMPTVAQEVADILADYRGLYELPDAAALLEYEQQDSALVGRIRQLETDAELGRLIRRMPDTRGLLTFGRNEGGTWGWFARYWNEASHGWLQVGPVETPEEALRKALGEPTNG